MKKVIFVLFLALSSCFPNNENPKPRLSLFIGVDISGSFLAGKHFDDSLDFLSHYIYAHLRGLGGLEVPAALFVTSIGGSRPNEPKTFFPIQTFEDLSVQEVRGKLNEIFPKSKQNPFTDYNAFFEHIAQTVKNKKLILRPISVVMISDGQPDVPGRAKKGFRRIDLKPLETLSRNVTIRLLYTSPVIGAGWQNKVPRKRVKIWTQDAPVMEYWNDPKILVPGQPLEKQTKFLDWVKDNVDFGVRMKRVD